MLRSNQSVNGLAFDQSPEKSSAASRVGMFYSSGTPDKPKSYARYDVIADDGKGTCTVRNMGGVEYPVASYLIDEMAEPAEEERSGNASDVVGGGVCPTCDGKLFTFSGEDCPTCHGTGATHPLKG
jgi:hypothetical protein